MHDRPIGGCQSILGSTYGDLRIDKAIFGSTQADLRIDIKPAIGRGQANAKRKTAGMKAASPRRWGKGPLNKAPASSENIEAGSLKSGQGKTALHALKTHGGVEQRGSALFAEGNETSREAAASLGLAESRERHRSSKVGATTSG